MYYAPDYFSFWELKNMQKKKNSVLKALGSKSGGNGWLGKNWSLEYSGMCHYRAKMGELVK